MTTGKSKRPKNGFIRARGIDVKKYKDGKMTNHRRNLIEVLEKADFDKEFHGFTRLPPELRLRIYEFHFADFQSPALLTPSQPPITRTCRLLRSEALPHFFKVCKFIMALDCEGFSLGWKASMQIPPRQLSFLHGTTDHLFGHLTRLDFCDLHEWDWEMDRIYPSGFEYEKFALWSRGMACGPCK